MSVAICCSGRKSVFGDTDLVESSLSPSKCVVHFDQLSGAARTQKLVETHFFGHFQLIVFRHFFLNFRREITEKGLKLTKKVENG